jgi:hypothetical protein
MLALQSPSATEKQDILSLAIATYVTVANALHDTRYRSVLEDDSKDAKVLMLMPVGAIGLRSSIRFAIVGETMEGFELSAAYGGRWLFSGELGPLDKNALVATNPVPRWLARQGLAVQAREPLAGGSMLPVFTLNRGTLLVLTRKAKGGWNLDEVWHPTSTKPSK